MVLCDRLDLGQEHRQPALGGIAADQSAVSLDRVTVAWATNSQAAPLVAPAYWVLREGV
jgi:hypothetical protein